MAKKTMSNGKASKPIIKGSDAGNRSIFKGPADSMKSTKAVTVFRSSGR